MRKEKIQKQYQWMIFKPLFIAACAIIIILNSVIFVVSAEDMFLDTQTSIKQIAASVAENIPVETHEKLIEPKQQNTDEYKKIEEYFQAVLIANPDIDDVYTLRPTSTPHQFTFVVSGGVTRDRNKNNKIDPSEYKANLGDPYDASGAPDLEEGLTNNTADKKITFDAWGAWLSGYAPLVDKSGKTVAVVGVDLAASTISADRWHIGKKFLLADAIILPTFLIAIYFLSRHFAKSMSKMVEAMTRVAHGEVEFRMTVNGSGPDAHIAELFNTMVSHFSDHIEHYKNKAKQLEGSEE